MFAPTEIYLCVSGNQIPILMSVGQGEGKVRALVADARLRPTVLRLCAHFVLITVRPGGALDLHA
jgi:hypothetical protein